MKKELIKINTYRGKSREKMICTGYKLIELTYGENGQVLRENEVKEVQF